MKYMTRNTLFWRIREIRRLLLDLEDYAQGTRSNEAFVTTQKIGDRVRDLENELKNNLIEA